MWRGGSKPEARVARWRVLLKARAPGAAVVPSNVSADVATRVGETRGLGAAGLNPERRPVHGFKAGAVGKMPDARHFSAAVGSEGARELIAVARCAVSQSLGRLPVPMVNVRGSGAVVDVGRRWALDERGTRASREIYFFVPLAMLAVDARGVLYHRRGVNYQCLKCQVDAHWDCIARRTKAHVRGVSRRGGRQSNSTTPAF